MSLTEAERILKLVASKRWLRIRDAINLGMNPETVRRLYLSGQLHRAARGIYTLPNIPPGEHLTLAETSQRVPQGVICLLSALRFHNLTTQTPFEVWIAIESKARRPVESGQPLRIIRMSGDAFDSGIEEYKIEKATVRVYNPAKTVADCFKFRGRIGLDVALEALHECWRERRCTIDEIWHYAKICRVANVMRPYMESLP